MRLRLQCSIYAVEGHKYKIVKLSLILAVDKDKFTLHFAQKYKNCRIRTVTDSISQKDFIEEQCNLLMTMIGIRTTCSLLGHSSCHPPHFHISRMACWLLTIGFSMGRIFDRPWKND